MEEFPTDESRQIPASSALQAVADDTVAVEGDFNRMTVQVLGNGLVVYRLHPRDGGDYVGGAVTP